MFWSFDNTWLTDPQNQNSYSYARNNPITLSDPSGKFTGLSMNPATAILMVLFSPTQTPVHESQQYSAQGDSRNQVMNTAIASLVSGGEGKNLNHIVKYGEKLGSKMNSIANSIEKTDLDFSEHSIQRMAQKNITLEQVVKTVKNNNPIEYFHEGALKNGFRDSTSKVFVGQAKDSGIITTVINNTSKNYLSNLVNKGKEALSKLKQ